MPRSRGSPSVIPGPAASASPGNSLDMQILGPYPRPRESEVLEQVPRPLWQ